MLIYHRCLDAGDLSPLGTRHLGWFGRIKLHADSRDRSQPPFLIFIWFPGVYYMIPCRPAVNLNYTREQRPGSFFGVPMPDLVGGRG